jgi:site-specific recombinase XerD
MSQENIDAFKAHLLVSGKSATTARDYVGKVRQFFRWVEDRPLTAQLLVDYRWYLQRDREPPLEACTIRLVFCALRAYLAWRRSQGERKLPDGSNVKLPRVRPTERYCPSEDDIRALFAAGERQPSATRWQRFNATRNLAILSFLCDFGLRRQELLDLKLSDVIQDCEPWVLRIRCGKGGKSRQYKIQGDTRPFLKSYLEARRELLGDKKHDCLWLVDPTRTLGEDGLQSMLNTLCSSAGVPRFTAHMLRHYMITRLCEIGGLAVASRGAGHSDTNITDRYVHANNSQLDQALAALASRSAPVQAGPAAAAPAPVTQVSLIACPACGHACSSRAPACPKCGDPLSDGGGLAVPVRPSAPIAPTAPRAAATRRNAGYAGELLN